MSAQPIRLVRLGRTTWWRTQTVYHAIADMMTESAPDTIVLTRPDRPYLCLGYHQIYDAVLDEEACQQRGLPVIRRRIGGGTTYLDGAQLFYQCIFHHSRLPFSTRRIYALLLAAPVATLRRLGLDARLRDINEVEVNGCRIAGTGGGRLREGGIVVGNVLFDFDYEAMTAVWRAPWPSFRALAAQALRERVTTLRRLLGEVDEDAVEALLVEEFERALGRPLVPGPLTPEEEERARALFADLTAPDFLALHSHSPKGPVMHSLKIAGGAYVHAVTARVGTHHVQGSLYVHDGLIRDARLSSSPPHDWRPVEIALCGHPFDDWLRVLRRETSVFNFPAPVPSR